MTCETSETAVARYSSPAGKLVRFFERSRNRWKAKSGQWKRTCKLLQNQTRAVEKSRAMWRTRAAAAEHRAADLEREIAALKSGR